MCVVGGTESGDEHADSEAVILSDDAAASAELHQM